MLELLYSTLSCRLITGGIGAYTDGKIGSNAAENISDKFYEVISDE